ncbi:exonuclease domain-containing protein [Candidatus Omnitrophota bacterium]
MDRPLKEIEFVIVDVETTGLSAQAGDRICEIAAMRVKDTAVLDVFHSLVNPQRPISFGAFEVNHITEEMLEDAPISTTVLPAFLDFIRGGCLVGYNVSFDLGFLTNELAFCGKQLSQAIGVVDVLKMARRLLPTIGRYPLWYVAQTLNISNPQKHRALADVALTKQVFTLLLEKALAKGIVSFANLHSLFGTNRDLNTDLNQDKLSAIQEAIAIEKQLSIKYFSSKSSEVTERNVTPKEIVKDGGYYFLKGYCHLRGEERSFRIDRVMQLEIV